MDEFITITTRVDIPMVWEDPPQKETVKKVKGENTVTYNLIAGELKKNPGRWAKLPTMEQGFSATLRRGKNPAFRPVVYWETLIRNGKVYIRYVGPLEKEE